MTDEIPVGDGRCGHAVIEIKFGFGKVEKKCLICGLIIRSEEVE